MLQTIHDSDIDLQSTERKLTQEYSLSEECSGIMGVPIRFLSKYNPKQFKIVGLANSARYIGDFPCYTVINGEKIYNRILIKRRKKDEN
ncbi:adenine-specific methyltransferase EcoRI family protein [Ruminococcus bromii]|uniref:adenine-specific methyltransferase EcoRI family protein n=1 Tax=Ruminococcus bromii TaxID=40518 RepID=UPI003AB7B4E0